MKPYETYQYLAGEPMTARDETEIGSAFWNKGKWDNFVLPLLPREYEGLTFVDVGCNAGLFLYFAENLGFKHVVGVDSNEGAVLRGREWRDKQGKGYEILLEDMNTAIDKLPISDYLVMANVHYYFKIDDWLRFLDRLATKTANCIIVTTKKRPGNRCWTQADLKSVRGYFEHAGWEETGFIEALPERGDPRPRTLWGLRFKSPYIERINIEELDSGNHVQDEFYAELDEGKDFKETKYYKIIRKYRLEDRKDWNEDKLHRFFEDRVSLYNKIKKDGLKEPIVIDSNNKILDGNHRCQMLKHLGNKSVLVRKLCTGL